MTGSLRIICHLFIISNVLREQKDENSHTLDFTIIKLWNYLTIDFGIY